MIHYVIGDATHPVGNGNKIIAHIVNDIGAWGRGFVLALSRMSRIPETEYRNNWRKNKLGYIQLCHVSGESTENTALDVANMFGQHEIYAENGVPPIRYEKLRQCLFTVGKVAKSLGSTVHMPRIGCGLAGGSWPVVEKIIQEELVDIEVYVYDLPKR
jgi:O-acetyl-ADP-ribose deacetylase (regulator of RNase III)